MASQAFYFCDCGECFTSQSELRGHTRACRMDEALPQPEPAASSDAPLPVLSGAGAKAAR